MEVNLSLEKPDISLNLDKKFNIFGNTFSLFTIIVFVILILLLLKFFFYGSEDVQTEENFGNHEKIKAYNFNTSWCGYSIQFQPEWNKFMEKANELNIEIYDVKCDNNDNESLCKQYGNMVLPGQDEEVLRGFPTVVFTVPDKQYPIVYNGSRDVNSLVEFTKSL